MTNHEKTLAAFWTDFAAGRVDQALELHFTADCEFVMPGVPPLSGRAAVAGLLRGWQAAFPDMKPTAAHAIESRDTYAAETDYEGTHRGALGEIPATQRVVRWRSADIIRFRDGRIASWHIHHDPAALFGQLR